MKSKMMKYGEKAKFNGILIDEEKAKHILKIKADAVLYKKLYRATKRTLEKLLYKLSID